MSIFVGAVEGDLLQAGSVAHRPGSVRRPVGTNGPLAQKTRTLDMVNVYQV